MNENQGRLPFDREPMGLVDAAWVAKRLGVTLRFVRRLVAERRIPYVKLGGPVRFEQAAVEQFIEMGRRPAGHADGVETLKADSTVARAPSRAKPTHSGRS